MTQRILTLALTATFILLLNRTSAQEVSASTSHSISITPNGVQRWRTSTGLSDFNIELRGKIELTDDDKDIKGMSDDGYLEVTKTAFGNRRTIIIESLGAGKIKREYYEGRTKMDWDNSGRAWLAEILPELVRTSTIGAEGRVNRFFRQGGAIAVLNEINQLEGDYVKAHYGKLLLDKNIPAGEMSKVITGLGDAISSDYYLATLLKDSMDKLLVSKEAGDAFYKATENISSDYYKSVVLKEALQKYSASPDQVATILKSASSIGSAYYLTVVLTTLLEKSDVKDESLTVLLQISKEIDSDYYRADVLSKAMKKDNISKAALKAAVDAVADIGSDYYKSNVFNAMAEEAKMDGEMLTQVLTIIQNSVNSDYYASVTLDKILKNQNLSEGAFTQLITTAGEINSAYYAANVLEDAAKSDLSKAQILALLKATENIDSDHYLTSVLSAVAPKVKNGDADLKDAYRQAAKKLSSETYYGRALRYIE